MKVYNQHFISAGYSVCSVISICCGRGLESMQRALVKRHFKNLDKG